MTGFLRIFHAGPRFSRGPALFLLILLLAVAGTPRAMADFRITELNAELAGAPDISNQPNIVLISDLHLSAENHSRRVFAALTDRLNLLKPDLLLIAGDIFHGDPKRKPQALDERWREFMGRLKERPKLGVFAVLGNHDTLRDEAEIRAILEKSGVRVLTDNIVPIRLRDSVLYLAGTGRVPDRPLPPEFLQKIAGLRPLLLLTHFPEIFDLVPDNTPLLVLAGHTHGGVIRIPGVKDGSVINLFSPAHRTKYVFGLYEKPGGKQLYVTAGIGGEGNSGRRINNPPEIVVIRLRAPGKTATPAASALPPPGTDPGVPGGN